MAAPTIWKNKINSHALFKELRKNDKSKDINIDCRNIAVVHQGYLYAWDSYNCCILVSNLNAYSNIEPSDFSNSKNESEDQSHRNGTSFQKLVCMRPPIHDVHRLLFNEVTGDLAVIGQRGVTVISIPKQRSRFARLGDGGDKIICKSKTIGERLFFDCDLHILEVVWHPGSSDHVVMLTTDNNLRIFDLNHAFIAKLTYNLQTPQMVNNKTSKMNKGDLSTTTSATTTLNTSSMSASNASRSRLNTSVALGETAVSFDIMPPIVLSRKRAPVKDTQDNKKIAWPMCILHGDGDVFYFLSTLPDTGDYATYFAGPLHLYPCIDFGNDACCIRYLPNTMPPVIAIATTSGVIYHCVIMSEQDGNKIEFNTVRCSPNYGANFYPPSALNLYVYETVQLELSLTSTPHLYSCPITLKPDKTHSDRYYCLHEAGIHCITLPWTSTLKQLCTGSDDGTAEKPATIEHILCLRPLTTVSSTQTLYAFSQTTDYILCLTGELHCLIINNPRHQKLPSLQLLSSYEEQNPSAPVSSKVAYPYEDSFECHIASILKHSDDNPIISAGSTDHYNEKECYDILVRITRTFREQNIKRLTEARNETVKKVRFLQEFKELQMQDLQQCRNEKTSLFETATNLSQKYESACQRQKDINLRLEIIVSKIQNRLPRLSEAERFVKNEFITIETSIQQMEKKLNKVRLKKNYQIENIKKHESISIMKVNEEQQKNIQNTLLKQSDELKDLVQIVNNLRNVLGQA